jgi:hypothetical protein
MLCVSFLESRQQIDLNERFTSFRLLIGAASQPDQKSNISHLVNMHNRDIPESKIVTKWLPYSEIMGHLEEIHFFRNNVLISEKLEYLRASSPNKWVYANLNGLVPVPYHGHRDNITCNGIITFRLVEGGLRGEEALLRLFPKFSIILTLSERRRATLREVTTPR